ncbi:MAG: hypothetical protein AB7I30_20920 [Isosphaeraceae bacterium]
MRHLVASLGLLLMLAGPVRAGELDADFGAKAPPAVVKPSVDPPPVTVAATELDAEAPTQSCFFRGGFGWGGYRGWGGLGWGGLGWGGLGWGGLGWGGLGWGGYGWGGYGGGWGYGYMPVVSYSSAYFGGGWGGLWGCW